MKIEIRETIDYNPTIEELAREIWELDEEQQCKLINALGEIGEKTKILFQLGYMVGTGLITNSGKWLCEVLGQYFGD